jgi:hypothetical protein
MTRRKKLILIAPLAVLAMAAFMALGSEIVLLLWNWLLPPLFGFHQITFWQAFGILVLSRILFGGFGFHRSRGPRFRRGMEGRFDWMTPEEREQLRQRFRQRMRERWGFGPATGESSGQ